MTPRGRAPDGASGRSRRPGGVRTRTRPTAFAAALLPAAVLILAACGAPTAPPTTGGPTVYRAADPVMITSPADRSTVSGPVYFAVQVHDPAVLPSLTLRVGGVAVQPTFPGETPLRVFLIPRDHPEGPLTLTASAVHAGQTFTASVEVDVVHAPPSSATVGARGGVVGDVEANGAISNVTIPAGVAQGASVAFETLTQDEVRNRTGVDYDALGVTFLGAQELRSTAPTGDQVLMTSGGFGPMVQPGQAVVSYRIVPDMGRGVGELMVINSASVTPSGDVISDPVVREQVRSVEVVGAAGVVRAALVGGSAGTLPPGPPGSQLRFLVGGLNPYAVTGYALRFRQGTNVVEVPALVGTTGDGGQYLLGSVPALPVGATTVELYAVANEAPFMAFSMQVTAAPTVADPKTRVDAAYAEFLARIAEAEGDFADAGMDLDLSPLTIVVSTARAFWAARGADDPELAALAGRLAGAGVGTGAIGGSRVATDAPVRALSGGLCLLQATKAVFDRDFARYAFKGDQFDLSMHAIGGRLTIDYLDKFAERLHGTPYDCDPIKDQLCEAGIGAGCSSDDEIVYPPGTPNDPRPRAFPSGPRPNQPNDFTTGMGSIPLPGGPLGGSGGGGGGGGPLALASGVSTASLARLEPGRYTVRVLVNDQPWPFATEIAADGYFFLPAIPGGMTSTLVVSDRSTFAECVLPIVGRSMDSASAVFVDLDACGEGVDPGDFTIVWAGGPTGASSQWNVAENWVPPRVPNASDVVLLPSLADVVQLPTGTTQVASIHGPGRLVLGNGTLQVGGDVDVRVVQIDHAGAALTVGGTRTVGTWDVRSAWSLPDEPMTVDHLLLSMPSTSSLTVPNVLTVEGGLEVVGSGTVRGGGTTVLAPGSENVIRRPATGPTAYVLSLNDAHVLENRGTLTIDDRHLQLLGGAGVVNHADGLIRLTRDPASSYTAFVQITGCAATCTFVNDGGVEVGLTQLADYRLAPGVVQNNGTIEVGPSVVLQIGSPTEHATALVNAGTLTGPGTLWKARAVAGSVFTHEVGATLDVGTLRILSDVGETTVALLGTIAPGSLHITGGVVTVPNALMLERLEFGVGFATLQSAFATTVTDTMVLGHATFTGTGTTTLAAGALAATQPGTQHRVAGGHTLVNAGTTTWSASASGTIFLDTGGSILNTGTFVVQNDLTMQGGGTFRNLGTVRKEIATGTSNWIGVCYDDEGGEGQVVLDSGDLSLTDC